MRIRCEICPKGCELTIGEIGDCRVRKNIGGSISCITYGKPCAIHVDPIEKKPLYHVLPGSSILSLGTAGCNLHCTSCQNAQISQSAVLSNTTLTPQEIAAHAIHNKIKSIAYTYAEPLVSYEFTYDCCKTASEAGLKNALITAAYINPAPLRRLCRYIDAANVDLKSFSDSFYQLHCNAHLKPVLNALKIMKDCGVILEITHLLIPTLNDFEQETAQLCQWIAENLGPETPLHFSRFFPQHQLQHLPPTPEKSLLNARRIAIESGLQFVYVGNMSDREGESTWCPTCGTLVIERTGYQIMNNCLHNGKCPNCETSIPGIWA